MIYIEGNKFTKTAEGMANFIDGNRSARTVLRYNTVQANCTGVHGAYYIEGHGIQGANRGYQWWEVYNNSINNDGTIHYLPFRLRAGSGAAFNNRITGNWSVDGLGLDIQRSGTSYATCGKCDGTSSWDENTPGESGWGCRDQVGRSYDSTLWISDPPGAYAQPLTPAYSWSNITETSSAVNFFSSTEGTTQLQENRDYYNYTASFNGTSGIGRGLDAAKPATCTTGVAYFSTDVGTLGTLYKCTATNTWSAYFTPAKCPHPLADPSAQGSCDPDTYGKSGYTLTGGEGDTIAPKFESASLNTDTLRIKLTEDVVVNTNTGFDLVCSGAGDEALAFVSELNGLFTYIVDRSVLQSETCTVAYTTGANYIEDTAGNDLDSFTAQTVQILTPPESPTKKLTITKTGSGCVVTSTPSGIVCGSTCEFDFTTATSVTLGSYFVNDAWNGVTYSGGCAGGTADLTNDVADCVVTCTSVKLLN
jgi:hypothetical protein